VVVVAEGPLFICWLECAPAEENCGSGGVGEEGVIQAATEFCQAILLDGQGPGRKGMGCSRVPAT